MNELRLRSSSTFTLVDYDADTGTEQASTAHTARFSITAGVLRDMKWWHRSHEVYGRFRPVWLEARWVNGELREVNISGPRLMRGGHLHERQFRTLQWRPNTFALDYAVVTLLIEYQRQALSVLDGRVSA